MNAPASSSGLPRRVILVAAMLEERFLNADCVAYGRMKSAEYRMFSGKHRKAPASTRRDNFWFSVGRALGRGPGCPTKYEQAKRAEINAARDVLRNGSETTQ
jgi:hypothetical protein